MIREFEPHPQNSHRDHLRFRFSQNCLSLSVTPLPLPLTRNSSPLEPARGVKKWNLVERRESSHRNTSGDFIL